MFPRADIDLVELVVQRDEVPVDVVWCCGRMAAIWRIQLSGHLIGLPTQVGQCAPKLVLKLSCRTVPTMPGSFLDLASQVAASIPGDLGQINAHHGASCS